MISTNYTVTNGGCHAASEPTARRWARSTSRGAPLPTAITAAARTPVTSPGDRDRWRLPAYLPDLTNNPTHGFEAGRFPNQTYYSATTGTFTFTPQNIGGSPVDREHRPGRACVRRAGPPIPTPTGPRLRFRRYDYCGQRHGQLRRLERRRRDEPVRAQPAHGLAVRAG